MYKKPDREICRAFFIVRLFEIKKEKVIRSLKLRITFSFFISISVILLTSHVSRFSLSECSQFQLSQKIFSNEIKFSIDDITFFDEFKIGMLVGVRDDGHVKRLVK